MSTLDQNQLDEMDILLTKFKQATLDHQIAAKANDLSSNLLSETDILSNKNRVSPDIQTSHERINTKLLKMLISARVKIDIVRDDVLMGTYSFRELTPIDIERHDMMKSIIMKMPNYLGYASERIKSNAADLASKMIQLHLASAGSVIAINTAAVNTNEPILELDELKACTVSVVCELFDKWVEWCDSRRPLQEFTEIEIRGYITQIKKGELSLTELSRMQLLNVCHLSLSDTLI